MTEHIKIESKDNILNLTIARPDKKNALTNVMYGALADALLAAETDPAARVIVYPRRGRHVHGGQRCRRVCRDRDRRLQGRTARRAVPAGDRACDPAAGRGGAGTRRRHRHDDAAALRLVVLAEDALLSTPFVNLALVPEAASTLLMPLRIGYARAYEMFTLGEPLDAKTALHAGIANRVVPLDRLHAEAAAIAQRLAKLPAGALAATKRLMRNPEALAAQIAPKANALPSG